MCWYCDEQKSIKSQDPDVDAILDEQGCFNVINNEGDPQFVERSAVFKFNYCPMCGAKLEEHTGSPTKSKSHKGA